jgi:hypothetical protein
MMRYLFLLGLALITACGSAAGPTSRAVGGACTSNSDCDQTCLTNQTFPAGYCTRPCTSDGDCASGSMCVKDDFGQICEVLCSTVQSCTAFGPKFACDQKALVAAAGSVMVCRSH